MGVFLNRLSFILHISKRFIFIKVLISTVYDKLKIGILTLI